MGGGTNREKLLPILLQALNNSSVLHRRLLHLCVRVWEPVISDYRDRKRDSRRPARSHHSHLNQIGAAPCAHSGGTCSDRSVNGTLDVERVCQQSGDKEAGGNNIIPPI